jgi:hypothetical protein
MKFISFLSTKLILGLFVLFTVSVARTEGAWAAGSISLSPASGSGSSFTIQVIIDTGESLSTEADLVLNYNPAVLQFASITFGDLYPENIDNADHSLGKLSTFSYFSGLEQENTFKGEGVLATVVFNGLTPGTAAVTVECVPGATNDSNIIENSFAGDILDCQLAKGGNYTVLSVGAGELTVTPTPRVTVTATPTPTPTRVLELGGSNSSPTPTPVQKLLESGSVTPTLIFSGICAMLLLGSLFLFIW